MQAPGQIRLLSVQGSALLPGDYIIYHGDYHGSFSANFIYVKKYIFTTPENLQRTEFIPVLWKGLENWSEMFYEASVVTREGILQDARMTVQKQCLTAAEGWTNLRSVHLQLYRTPLNALEAHPIVELKMGLLHSLEFRCQVTDESLMHAKDSPLLYFAQK